MQELEQTSAPQVVALFPRKEQERIPEQARPLVRARLPEVVLMLVQERQRVPVPLLVLLHLVARPQLELPVRPQESQQEQQQEPMPEPELLREPLQALEMLQALVQPLAVPYRRTARQVQPAA